MTYLHTLYPNLKNKIDEALKAGYSLQEIHDYIEAKTNEAKLAGYTTEEINAYTGAAAGTPKGYNPFLAQLYRGLGALTGGTAQVMQNIMQTTDYLIEEGKKLKLGAKKDAPGPLDAWLKESLGIDSSDLVRQTVNNSIELLKSNSKYYEDLAKEKGAGFIDELIGDAVGGFIPWVAEFKMGVPYFFAKGAAEARSQGQNEFWGGIRSAVERGILGKLFEVFSVLKKPYQAVATGGTFATQTWAQGGDPREIAKSFLTGVLYSMGGKGRIGVKEIRDLHKGTSTFELKVRGDYEIEKEQIEETNRKIKEIPDGESRPAIETKDGKIIIGEKNEPHELLVNEVGLENWKRSGFIDKEGKFSEEITKEAEKPTKEVEKPTEEVAPAKEAEVPAKETEEVTLAKEGVEHGAGAVSVEELARPGVNYSVSKTGKIGYLGKQVDLPPGAEAVISVLPDGKLQVRATKPGLTFKNAEAKYGEKIKAAFEKAKLGEKVTEKVAEKEKVVEKAKEETYEEFIEKSLGAAAARKEIKLYSKLLEEQKKIEANLDKLKNLATTNPAKVFMEGNIEALEQYAQRVDREVFIKKMEKFGRFGENSYWLQEGYDSAGDFWDRNAAASPEIHKLLYDRNWSKVGSLARDIDKEISQLINTAERMSRAAYASGDKEGALREHKRMLELQRERSNIKREHDRVRRETQAIVNTLNRIAEQKNIAPEYKEHILDILEDYDLHFRSKAKIREREQTLDFLARLEAAGETIYISKEQLARLRRRSLNDLTMDELRNLESVIKQLAHQGVQASKLFTIGKRKNFETMKGELLVSMRENIRNFKEPEDIDKKFPSEREPGGLMGKFRKKIGQLHPGTKVEYIMDRLDGFKGRMYEVRGKWAEVFQSRVDAEVKELKLIESDVTALKAAVEPIKKQFAKMLRDKEIIGGRSLTRMEAISVYWNSKNEGNRNALKHGFGMSDADIDAIVKSLTPQELKFADDVMKIIQDKGPQVAEVLKNLTGEKMKFEKDYFPLWFDAELSDRAAERAQEVDLMKQVYSKVSVGRKFTVSRTGGVEAPYISLDVVIKHLDRVNHFIANAEAVRDFQKLLFDKDIRRAIEANAGEGAYREMIEWLKEWANPKTGYAGEIDKIFGMLRHNATLASLGIKLSTVVLQPLAYFQLINRIGARNAMAGLLDFYRNPRKNWEIIKDLSPTMKSRRHSFDRDLIDFLNADPYFSQRAKLREAAMYAISGMDLATTAPAWWSAYNMGMKKFGWDQKRAVDYADKIIRTTQGSGLSKDLPNVLRGGNFKKSFAMFYTYFSATYNEAMRDVRATRAGEIGIPQLMRTFIWLFVVPAAFETLLKKREDIKAKDYVNNLIINIGTSIPYVGPFINAAVTGFDYTISPTLELPKELLDIWKAKKPMTKLKHAIMATGYLTGFPARQAILTMQYLNDVVIGKSYDPANLIYREKEEKGGKW